MLSRAQRRILERLRDAEDRINGEADEAEYPEYEIVCEGLQCYIGLEKTNWILVLALLRIMAISDRSDHGFDDKVRRFQINECGRNFLKDESQIDVVRSALVEGGAWTWERGKYVRLP